MSKNISFPAGFFWGASTSSHQVEGNCHNDWTEWEKTRGQKEFLSGLACDQYTKYKEDFVLAKELGHNATRLSIEWSRVEPQKGKFDKQAIQHYMEVIQTLRELHIEPVVTLYHWTLPVWLAAEGGWLSKQSVEYFARFVETVVKALPEVHFWITLNEPEIYTSNSYLQGVWPPQKKSIVSAIRVYYRLLQAHKQAYQSIKQILPKSQVGIAKNNIYFEAARNIWINKLYKKVADYFWNEHFLNRIQKFQDFIGLNYYFHNRIESGFGKNENKKVSDMGWELYPQGIYFVLKDLQKYGIPVLITENGVADAKDEHREWCIRETLRAIHQAIQEGVDVRGYLHWSLLDNFEWDKGFWPRFGLIEVDYITLERKPRSSAYFYKDICKNNRLKIE